MFGFGFWELVVVMVVALIVVGPERMPQIARTAGLWIGRLRRMADGVRDELERELAAEELKQDLKRLEQDTGIEELNQAMRDTEGELRKAAGAVDAGPRYEILEEEAAGSAEETPADSAGATPPEAHRPAPAADAAPGPTPASEPRAEPEPAPERTSKPHHDGTHDGTA